MSDIVFLNLERVERKFLKVVAKERQALKTASLQLPRTQRPTFRNVDATSPLGIYNAVVSAKRIIHIAAHGQYFGAKIRATSPAKGATGYSLAQFADELEASNSFLDVDCIILDSCYSAGYPWRKQLQRIVGPGKEIVVISSAWGLEYKQAEVFFRDFYSYLLETRLPRSRADFRERVKAAFNSAQYDYLYTHGWWSQLRVQTIKG
jgi:hypothetical protein